MGNSNRQILLDKYTQLETHLKNAEAILQFIHNSYFPDYPEYYPPIQEAGKAVNQLIEFLRTFREVM